MCFDKHWKVVYKYDAFFRGVLVFFFLSSPFNVRRCTVDSENYKNNQLSKHVSFVLFIIVSVFSYGLLSLIVDLCIHYDKNINIMYTTKTKVSINVKDNFGMDRMEIILTIFSLYLCNLSLSF